MGDAWGGACVPQKWTRSSKSFCPNFLIYLLESESQSFSEVVSFSEGPLWKESINSEIDSILQYYTWELIDLPPGCKHVGYKWTFKKKNENR